MKKVLIALDYDPSAQKIAEAGFSLAKAMNAQVVLIHVISDPVFYSSTAYSPVMGFGGFADMDFMQPNIIDELKKAAHEFLNKSKIHLGDTDIETLVKEGDEADMILEAAKESNADLIILGSHSQRWLEAMVIGSVTEKVLRYTTVSLFIIPTKSLD